jgi:hypothetical protein
MSGFFSRYPVTDARKPFVCQQCGVGFAREKALSSHAKVSYKKISEFHYFFGLRRI